LVASRAILTVSRHKIVVIVSVPSGASTPTIDSSVTP
jgi:hypothetical protein